MKPAARISAAIELIDAFLQSAENMDWLLLQWGRANRYAGSGDRRAIADLVHDGLRRLRSGAWAGGAREPNGRAVMLGLHGPAPFTGERHAPVPLAPGEPADLGPMPEPVALDYPDWLDPVLRASLGSARSDVMMALRERAPVFLRVNRLRADAAEAIRALHEDPERVRAEALGDGSDALLVREGARAIARNGAYLAGLVEIQDASSQAVARFAAAEPGETVLDYCAGGGGKTLALGADMAGQGRLLAHDADRARLGDLAPRAARAGLAVEIADPDDYSAACDLVFADAPCSGSGAWRRNPDAKWRLTPERLAELTRLQDRVLDGAAAAVRPGGRLVYATCSVLAPENDARLAAFLARNPAFKADGALSLLPRPGEPSGDGFFAARLIHCGK